jgi:hypothetical protein
MRIEPAARLVLLALREHPHGSRRSTRNRQLRTVAEAIHDWDQVITLAHQQRVMPYLIEAVDRAALPLPQRAVSAVQRSRFVSAAQRLRLEAELGHIVAASSSTGVPVLVLKGPGLARTLYRDRNLRPYGDIDLTIHADHESALVSILQALGYTEESFAAEVARREHASHAHGHAPFHRLFRSADGVVLVEVHLDPLQLGLRPTRESERWSRVQPIPGVPGALMLGWEDQFVQLCVHAHKHGWNRLIWLKDIDLLLRVHGESLDWELIQQTARAEGIAASVWYTLRILRILLGVPVPDRVVARFRPAWLIQLAYRYTWPLERVANLGAHMRRRAVQFHGAESWRGMLPSLILMGRRAERVRAIIQVLQHPRPGRRRRVVTRSLGEQRPQDPFGAAAAARVDYRMRTG